MEIRAEKLAGLRYISTIESTANSTRIEGARLSDDGVERVLQGLTIDSFLERDAEEVRGYGELLQTIYDGYEAMALTENHIKQLHAIELKYSAKDERHRGAYKKLSNDVVAKDPDGRTEIIFRAATRFDTPRLMAELVAGTNAAFEEGELHRLIVIARFVVGFLAIHPFQDGNGRQSRARRAEARARNETLRRTRSMDSTLAPSASCTGGGSLISARIREQARAS
jgi:Fic family protein